MSMRAWGNDFKIAEAPYTTEIVNKGSNPKNSSKAGKKKRKERVLSFSEGRG